MELNTKDAAVSQDKMKVDLNAELNAQELEEVLMELAKVRSGMLPAVSEEPPGHESPAEVLPEQNPLFTFRTLANGGLRIWLRHSGYGWIPITLSPQDRENIRQFLGQKAGDGSTKH